MSLSSRPENGSSPAGGRARRLFRAFLDWLIPPRCVSCSSHGSWLCPTCIDQITFFEPPWPNLLEEMWPLQGVRSAAHLSGPLRKAIHRFKYRGLRAAARPLGELLVDCWEAEPLPAEVIVPVPLHPQRERERGYNQSALLARELSRGAALPLVEGALLRVQPTTPQVELNARERAENVRGAFRCSGEELRGRAILLVDDVLTSGATLRACAQALLEINGGPVWALTLAHG